MRIKHIRQIMLSSLITLCFATGAWASEGVFSNFTFDQAKQEAEQSKKLLLIDFTAVWCPPCKRMESTTWVDSEVQSWIKENAVAIQVDVDKDEKTSRALNIEAMPTVILFTPQNISKEFGRHVGYMDAAGLLRWMKKAKSGKSAIDVEKETAESNEPAIWERLGKARQLQTDGKSAEALDEYIWLWSNVSGDGAGMTDLRHGMVPMEIKRLCATVPNGKAKIVELRNAADKADNRNDWILLNSMLDEPNLTLSWFDKAKTDPNQKAKIQELSNLLEPILYTHSRWADIVTVLYPDPIARVNELHKRAEAMKHPGPDTEVSKDFDPLPSMVLLLYGSYVSAGKDSDAQKIADECIKLDNTAAMKQALENMAKGAVQAREAQKKPTANAVQKKPLAVNPIKKSLK